MKLRKNQYGFSSIILAIAIIIVAGLAFGGWYVWSTQGSEQRQNLSSEQSNDKNSAEKDDTEDIAKEWAQLTTQDSRLSMRIPDGWTVTNYPGSYVGSTRPTYKAGQRAVIEVSDTEHYGHALLFRASITEIDDAGLGPQWASPQPGLQESTEDFTVGQLRGKRYKGIFSQGLNQTLYEYVFDLGSNEKLDIVYTVDHSQNGAGDVITIEKMLQTISVK